MRDHNGTYAPVAQLDRVSGYEPGGQRFESSPVRFLQFEILMQIKKIISSPLKNNTYVLIKEKKALAIDPTFESIEKILHFLNEEKVSLEAILLTHSHFDHISGVAKLKRETKAKIYVHRLDSENLEKPGSDKIPLFEKIEGAIPDVHLNDGDIIYFEKAPIKVLHTPGHTRGSVCYYLENEKMLFSGDTLFAGTYGYVRSEESKKQILASLKKLSKLPKDTKVYPGHGSATTIEQESWLEEDLF